ncbi:MAG: DUF1289 domain-containing protein [Robiginitomaculum sp.]
MTANAPIVSPCILVCTLDLSSGQCTGCGRSREHIAKWSDYSDDERAQIMESLPGALARLRAASKMHSSDSDRA